jgi:hypothetical protein
MRTISCESNNMAAEVFNRRAIGTKPVYDPTAQPHGRATEACHA